MLRFVRRKLVLCIVLIAGFCALKERLPQIGETISGWIFGTKDSRVASAFSEMYKSFSDGKGIGEAVEVFYDGLQSENSD